MQDACERGYRFACVQYGNLFFADGPAWKQDYTKSHEYFERACGGMVTAKDPARLVPQGQAYGCTNLGVLYENAWGVERDVEKAHALSKFACDLDYGNGCNQVGVFIRRGRVAEPDAPAMQYFLKACTHADGTGCCNVATELAKGEKPLGDGRNADHFVAKAREYRFDCEKWEPIPPSSQSEAVE